jgi:hypothetical protein
MKKVQHLLIQQNFLLVKAVSGIFFFHDKTPYLLLVLQSHIIVLYLQTYQCCYYREKWARSDRKRTHTSRGQILSP